MFQKLVAKIVKILMFSDLFACFSKTTFTRLIIDDDLPKILFSKIGPQNGRKEEFGVGNLPEQKIADSVFATCADEDARIRKSAFVKMLLESFGGDEFGIQKPLFGLQGNLFDGIDDFGATAVTQGQRNGQPCVVGSLVDGGKKSVAARFG